MQLWDEDSEKVTKITSDKEKAASLLCLVELREKDLSIKKEEFSTLIVEGYYEIIKELITAIMAVDGWKTLGHELLVGYVAQFYKELSSAEINLVDQLRKIRNDIGYRGIMVNTDYLKRNKELILNIIKKLKNILRKKIK